MEESSQNSARQNAPIRLGYVPLIDVAPLIVAKEFGLFAERGLSVELVREPGWATVRDKLVPHLLRHLKMDQAFSSASLSGVPTSLQTPA